MSAHAVPADLLRALIALVLGLALVGCAAETGTPPAPPPSRHGQDQARQGSTQALHAIADAVLSDDRAAYQAVVSSRDSSFASTAELLFDNLTGLDLKALSFDSTGQQRNLSAERQQVLGEKAWAGEVVVNWQLTGDQSPAQHTLWLTWVPSGDRLALAGISDGPTGVRQPQPLWTLEPVRALSRGQATVIGGPSADLERWAQRGNQAAVAVAAGIDQTAPQWSGQIVIELPSTVEVMERQLGAKPGSMTSLAATTWPAGVAVATAPPRIVLNPSRTAKASELALEVLLSHEAVHVATRAAASKAPMWLVEGYADEIALRAYPKAAKPMATTLFEAVRIDGAPPSLPIDADFEAGAKDLNRSYAEAWLACRYLADTYGPAKLDELYAAADQADDLAEPLRRVLDSDLDQLTAGWRDYLQAQAGR